MNCNPTTASVQIKEIQNCVFDSEEGTIINLSPEFPIPKEDLHRDHVFPSLHHVQAVSEMQRKLGVEAPKFSSFYEARAWALKQKGLNELWPIVKKGWSLTSKGKLDLAAETLKQYREGQYKEPHELRYVLFDFCCRILLPLKYHLFEDAAVHCQKITKNHISEFQRFRSFFKSRMATENLDRRAGLGKLDSDISGKAAL